jgi:multidrug resistance efflux pump
MRMCPKIALAMALLMPGTAAADPAQAEGGNAGAPATPVSLDALLKLPKSAPSEQAEGSPRLNRQQWDQRFVVAEQEIADARAALKASQAELMEMSTESGAWQMAPPGASANSENSPLSFRLRQQIRDQREQLEQAELDLDELRIQADFAGVPQEWQR